MRELMIGLDGLTAREAISIIGCLQREIDLIERGGSNWSLYEDEYRSAAAKLRALVLTSRDAHDTIMSILEDAIRSAGRDMSMLEDAIRNARGDAEDAMRPKQLTIPGFLDTEFKTESSAGPDRPTEANMEVENGNSAIDNAASI